MQIGRISGCTRVLGKSQGSFGPPLRDVVIHYIVTGPSTQAMETAWLPDPAELAAIAAGAPIVLRVVGTSHPPVMLPVGDRPAEPIPSQSLLERIVLLLAEIIDTPLATFAGGAEPGDPPLQLQLRTLRPDLSLRAAELLDEAGA